MAPLSARNPLLVGRWHAMSRLREKILLNVSGLTAAAKAPEDRLLIAAVNLRYPKSDSTQTSSAA
jgi:hypothetical protein